MSEKNSKNFGQIRLNLISGQLSLLFARWKSPENIRFSKSSKKTRPGFKMFDCKKCPVHLVSFIKHHGLFVPYIVDIFDCKKCHTHLVSFIKRHGLFVPYIVANFIFLIRKSWFSPSYIHPVQGFLFFF